MTGDDVTTSDYSVLADERSSAYRAWKKEPQPCPSCAMEREAHYMNEWENCVRIEGLTSKNAKLRQALVTLGRYTDSLRASGWGGLASTIEEALDGS